MSRFEQTASSFLGSVGLMVGITDLTNIINIILLILSTVNIGLVLFSRVKKITEENKPLDDKIDDIKGAIDEAIEDVNDLKEGVKK